MAGRPCIKSFGVVELEVCDEFSTSLAKMPADFDSPYAQYPLLGSAELLCSAREDVGPVILKAVEAP